MRVSNKLQEWGKDFIVDSGTGYKFLILQTYLSDGWARILSRFKWTLGSFTNYADIQQQKI